MIRIAVVDDQKIMRDFILSEVEKVFFKLECEYIFELYETGNDFIDAVSLQNIKYDLVLLDIEMPDITGLDVSKKLFIYCSNAAVIFITSHKELLIDAFGFNVFAFINKDELHERIEDVLFSLLKFIDKIKSITLKTEEGVVKFPLMSIIAFVFSLRKMYIYLTNGSKIQVYVNTLLEVKEMLNDELFINLSRATLVNLRYIESTKNLKATIIGRDDIIFDIAESKKSQVDKKLLNLLIGS